MDILNSPWITICSDVLAILMISALLIRSSHIWKKESGYRLLRVMLFSSMADALCNAVCYFLHDKSFAGAYTLAVISQTALEIAIVSILCHWLLFVDYQLYSSRDHLKRHYRPYLMPVPVFVLLHIVNAFTGILYTIDAGLRCERSIFYNVILIIEYCYVVISLAVILKYRKEHGSARFFSAIPMILPLVAAVAISELTPHSFVALGFAVGLVNIYLYLKRYRKYYEEETGFFNAAYLEYIKTLEEKGDRGRGVMIRISSDGDNKAVSDILRQELPADAEVIFMGKGRYLMFAGNKNRQFANLVNVMLQDAVEEYNAGNPQAKIRIKADIISGNES